MKQKLMLVGYKNPSEDRFMLADIDWLEELDPNIKYEFWFDEKSELWICRTTVGGDNE